MLGMTRLSENESVVCVMLIIRFLMEYATHESPGKGEIVDEELRSRLMQDTRENGQEWPPLTCFPVALATGTSVFRTSRWEGRRRRCAAGVNCSSRAACSVQRADYMVLCTLYRLYRGEQEANQARAGAGMLNEAVGHRGPTKPSLNSAAAH